MPRNAVSFLVESIHGPGKPGAIQFNTIEGKLAGFTHACPCGCGKWSFVKLNPEVWSPESRTPMWTREGDDLHMTISPSIGIKPMDAAGQYHWHGYLRNGVFEEC